MRALAGNGRWDGWDHKACTLLPAGASSDNPPGMPVCDLCEMARTTHWYAEYEEPFRFAILDCDSCDVPMAVLREHRATPTDAEREVMQRTLADLANTKYPNGWFFDDHMRQIPEHYHLHARPYPAWLPRSLRAR